MGEPSNPPLPEFKNPRNLPERSIRASRASRQKADDKDNDHHEPPTLAEAERLVGSFSGGLIGETYESANEATFAKGHIEDVLQAWFRVRCWVERTERVPRAEVERTIDDVWLVGAKIQDAVKPGKLQRRPDQQAYANLRAKVERFIQAIDVVKEEFDERVAGDSVSNVHSNGFAFVC